MGKYNSVVATCGLCFGILFILGLVAGSVAYVVFGIMGLVQEYDDAQTCGNMNLWVYVLVVMILQVRRGADAKTIAKDNSDATETTTALTCSVCLSLGMGVWGIITVLDAQDCMDNSGHLFVVGYISAVLDLVICGVYVLMLLVVCALSVCSSIFADNDTLIGLNREPSTLRSSSSNGDIL
jgi:hypothetical protein